VLEKLEELAAKVDTMEDVQAKINDAFSARLTSIEAQMKFQHGVQLKRIASLESSTVECKDEVVAKSPGTRAQKRRIQDLEDKSTDSSYSTINSKVHHPDTTLAGPEMIKKEYSSSTSSTSKGTAKKPRTDSNHPTPYSPNDLLDIINNRIEQGNATGRSTTEHKKKTSSRSERATSDDDAMWEMVLPKVVSKKAFPKKHYHSEQKITKQMITASPRMFSWRLEINYEPLNGPREKLDDYCTPQPLYDLSALGLALSILPTGRDGHTTATLITKLVEWRFKDKCLGAGRGWIQYNKRPLSSKLVAQHILKQSTWYNGREPTALSAAQKDVLQFNLLANGVTFHSFKASYLQATAKKFNVPPSGKGKDQTPWYLYESFRNINIPNGSSKQSLSEIYILFKQKGKKLHLGGVFIFIANPKNKKKSTS